jgi:D-alanine-D-alanine ligase-like ATP-grasp enzyme
MRWPSSERPTRVSEPAKFSLDPDFFDYEAKYGARRCLTWCPSLTREQRAEILGFARRVFDTLELTGTARIDSFGGRKFT